MSTSYVIVVAFICFQVLFGNMESQAEVTSQIVKHVWTPEEDNMLVECLVELRTNGKFLTDNGFRPGYLLTLENMMNQKATGCGLKGIPHIQSRIKTLKQSWQTVYDMVYGSNTSGFGWDPDRKVVITEKEVWEEYLKVIFLKFYCII